MPSLSGGGGGTLLVGTPCAFSTNRARLVCHLYHTVRIRTTGGGQKRRSGTELAVSFVHYTHFWNPVKVCIVLDTLTISSPSVVKMSQQYRVCYKSHTMESDGNTKSPRAAWCPPHRPAGAAVWAGLVLALFGIIGSCAPVPVIPPDRESFEAWPVLPPDPPSKTYELTEEELDQINFMLRESFEALKECHQTVQRSRI